MREIKFDAIYKPTGEHFNPIEINFNDNTITGNFDGKIMYWCNFSLDGKWGDVILRQYTGLKDRTGREIYESDVVKNHRLNCGELLQVKWQEGEAEQTSNGIWWTPEKPGFRFVRIGKGMTTVYVAEKDLEVIGNVYENPELLEK